MEWGKAQFYSRLNVCASFRICDSFRRGSCEKDCEVASTINRSLENETFFCLEAEENVSVSMQCTTICCTYRMFKCKYLAGSFNGEQEGII